MKIPVFEFSSGLASGATILAGIALALPAQARPVASLSELFQAQLARVPAAVEACSLAEGADDGEWEFTNFLLDVSPFVTVGIPGMLQVQVTPEMTFVWSRED